MLGFASGTCGGEGGPCPVTIRALEKGEAFAVRAGDVMRLLEREAGDNVCERGEEKFTVLVSLKNYSIFILNLF